MSQEWLVNHSLYFPASVTSISFLVLLVQRLASSKTSADAPATSGSSGLLKNAAQRVGGTDIFCWLLARFVGCLALVAMTAATVFLDKHEEHGLGYKVTWDGPSAFQWSARTTAVHATRPSWTSMSLLVTYAYCSALSLFTLITPPRAVHGVQKHLCLTLLAAWLVYFARDVFPLATYTIVSLDTSDELLWPKIAVLSLVGVVVPLCIPHPYIPLDPANPTAHPPPEQTTSWLSFVTFSFLDPLVWKGYRSVHLGWDQLPSMADYDGAEHLRQRAFPDLDPFDPANPPSKRRHLFFHLMHVFRSEYVFLALGMALRVLAAFLAPIGLNRLLTYIESGGEGAVVRPWVWIVWLFLGPFLGSLVFECYIFVTTRMLVRTEAIVTQLVFEHALRIRIKEETQTAVSESSTLVDGAVANGKQPVKNISDTTKGHAKSTTNAPRKADNLVGKINNLVTTDLNNIVEARDFLYIVIYCPLQIVICIWFLYEVLGVASFAGLATMVVTFPLPGWVASQVNRITKERAKKTDARVQEVTEVVGLLRMIKLFAWEPKIEERMSAKREDELTWIWKTRAMALVNMNLNFAIPLVTMMVAYTTYTLILGGELSASRVFSSMVVFEMLRDQFRVAGFMVPAVIQAKVSLDRLSDFLYNTELLDRYADVQDEHEVLHTTAADLTAIGFQDASFRWTASSSPPASGSSTPGSTFTVSTSASSSGRRDFILRIPKSLQFVPGALNLVVGPTGCGKTSLLLALCGELHFLPHSPASWFNLPRDGGVAYAAQEGWVQNETIRDNILFGAPFDEERYWKVVYQCGLERDLSLFDAGDLAEVGEKGLTLSGGQKARITLARAVYSSAAVLLLDDVLAALDVHTSKWIVDKCFKGDLIAGRTIILVTHNIPLVADVAAFVVSLSLDARIVGQGSVAEVLSHSDSKLVAQVEDAQELDDKELSVIDAPKLDKKVDNTPRGSGKLIVAEEIATGHVSWPALALYFKSLGGAGFWLVYLTCLAVSNFVIVMQTWFLGYWAQQYEDAGEGHAKDVPAARYVSGYGALVALSLAVYSVAFMVFLIGSMRASRTIHNRLISSILGTTLRWLDIVPVSRVITRCTQDLRSIDGPLGVMCAEVAETSFAILTRLAAIVVMSPVFTFPGILIALIGWGCGQVYIKSQLSVKREMSNARSPVLGHFGAAIAGLTSIRAYGAEAAFKASARHRIDKYTRAARSYYNLNRWIGVRINAIGGLFSAGLAAYLVYGTVPQASSTGFSLSLTVAFSRMILWWTRNLNQFEVEGNSLERIQQFIDIEQEPKPTERGKPPAYWPSSGSLRVEHLEAKYSSDGPLVLHDINFEVASGQRIGVVGRTGSGKSSLTLSLLRAIFVSGHVYYDDIATDSINLDALRSNITIIPQQPELLSGTLRQNLDPFDQHDDATLNDALQAAGLFRLQEGFDEGRITLDSAISTGGGNLSLGQRQIIALARAIARRSKIMILDEATAAVDYATDTSIQESIRHNLNDVTLIIVAHRLRTIMDADKIMVLDAGRLVEFDSPKALLEKSGGLLRSLVDESADRDDLIAMAK
ncbi:P-loop containing nucleoside triphosphate hydrolase protein [Exidia glandulosa HHB12029]|uniref:p-loop containing nucleoside triphosphate hydrolase protein n=1 Tax=Exidia glandulosa HHB12029 TaxID=1314781 RepID=A0A165H6T5_EXIGL|nr:P-loop containing nucleoside triphosphate hydrolase protein [Exidia glandulosa HHB12029]